MRLDLSLSLGSAALSQGGGASVYAPYPAPTGWRWDFVTFQGERVMFDGQPTIAMVEAV